MNKFIINLLLLCIISSYVTAQSYSGLIGRWSFNGSANDASGHGLNGIVHGATLTTGYSGVPNTAYKFNGTSDYITVPYDSSMNTKIHSICALIKPTGFYNGICQGNAIVWRGPEGHSNFSYLLEYFDNAYDNNDCYGFEPTQETFAGGTGISTASEPITDWYYTPTIDSNTWYCVVLTYDGDSTRIYVDGVLKKAFYNPCIYNNTTDSLNIGRGEDVPSPPYYYWLNGVIDEVRLYNRVLSPSEAETFCDSSKMSPVTPPSDTVHISGADTGCNTYRFTASSNDTGMLTYKWNFGDGSSGTGNPIWHRYTSAGTYTVTVTTTNSTGVTATDTYNVTTTISSVHAFNDTTICLGASAQLHETGGNNFVWTPATSLNDAYAADPIAKPDLTTTYVITNVDTEGCTNKDSVTVTVVPLPNIIATINSNFHDCKLHTIHLSAQGADSYIWQPGIYCNDSTSPTPIVSIAVDTLTFKVIGTDKYGCTSSASLKVTKQESARTALPSAFSPNGDGVNDILYVRGNSIQTMHFAVYNRWGQKVFETSDIGIGWDGTFNGVPQPVDAYVYVVRITNAEGCPVVKKGSVYLLR